MDSRDLQDYRELLMTWEAAHTKHGYLARVQHDQLLGPILRIADLLSAGEEEEVTLLRFTVLSGISEKLDITCCLFRSMHLQTVGFLRYRGVWLPVYMRLIFDGTRSRADIWFNERSKLDPHQMEMKTSEFVCAIRFQPHTLPAIHGLLRCNVDPKYWIPMGLLYIGKDWWPVLCEEFEKPYFEKLCEFVTNQRSGSHVIYPAPNDTFAWTRYCRPSEVKVVIVGKDPYTNRNRATGLAFNLPEHKKISKSVGRIYKALEKDFNYDSRWKENGDLTPWAKAGVLLLNSVLTVRDDQKNSHVSHGWEYLTSAVIKYISEMYDGVVFMLWGELAQRNESDIVRPGDGESRRHCVLVSYHPTYTKCECAKKREELWDGEELPEQLEHFDDCMNLVQRRLFTEANSFLRSRNKEPIEWQN